VLATSELCKLENQNSTSSQKDCSLTAADITQLWNKSWNRVRGSQSSCKMVPAGVGATGKPRGKVAARMKVVRLPMKSKKTRVSTKRMWKQTAQGRKVMTKSKSQGKSLTKGVSPSKTTRDQSAGTRSKDGPTPKKQRIKSKTSPESLTPQIKTTSNAHTKKLQQHQNAMSGDSEPKKHVHDGEMVSQAKVVTDDAIGQEMEQCRHVLGTN